MANLLDNVAKPTAATTNRGLTPWLLRHKLPRVRRNPIEAVSRAGNRDRRREE
jgi:hypothetical protein